MIKSEIRNELISIWNEMGKKYTKEEGEICADYLIRNLPEEISKKKLLRKFSTWLLQVMCIDDGHFSAPVPSKPRYFLLIHTFAVLLKDGRI